MRRLPAQSTACSSTALWRGRARGRLDAESVPRCDRAANARVAGNVGADRAVGAREYGAILCAMVGDGAAVRASNATPASSTIITAPTHDMTGRMAISEAERVVVTRTARARRTGSSAAATDR